jgi:hypothetical protein
MTWWHDLDEPANEERWKAGTLNAQLELAEVGPERGLSS